MKRLFKKSLTLLLALTMVIGAAPLAGLVGLELPSLKDVFADKAEAATYRGTCGNNLDWTLDTETGVLAVNGTGAMAYYSSSSSVPWDTYRSFIKTIIISNGVTSIGDWAFWNCYKLTTVAIPDTVSSLGTQAFTSCTGLTSVTIPDSVTSIGDRAFCGCYGLTSIAISESITSIGDYAFSDCTGLKSVTIPDSVKSIGGSAFSHCTELTSVTIGDGVTSIGDWAFCECACLTSITIPNSVTSIGDRAFGGCTSLVGIMVDNDNEFYSSDESGVLFNKDKTVLIQYPEGNERTEYLIPDSVTSIGGGAFYFCTSLTNITIPDSVTSIGDGAFYCCYGLASITIPDSVTSIGGGAFYICTSLTSITIPDSVTSIGGYALYGCISLTSVTFVENSELTSIDFWMFYGCTSLTSVKIPNSVTSIGENAFEYCESLTSVTIPNSVTVIGNEAFFGCTSLTSVTIPCSVTSIGDRAFGGCTSLVGIMVDDDNEFYSSDESGVLFNKDKTVLIQYPVGNERISYTIPNGITSIGDCAFLKCACLTSVTISNSVTSIGDWAFCECACLTSITIPNSVTSIGEYAFYCCYGLASITIPDSVTSIGDGAFYFCTSLTSITILDSVKSIGRYVFYGCTGLKSITIGSGVTSIGNYAFDDCTSLTDVYYAGTEEQWNAIGIGSDNSCLTNANIHYGEDPETPGEEINIAVLTTERSLCVKTGESMSLSFGLMKNGLLDGEWKKMSVVVSDPSIVSLSDYRKTYFGYAIDVKGEKKGSTNFVVTDTESGKSISFIVNVYDSFVGSSSFDINNISTFYPNNKWESKIQTNIYNMNGLYINNYNCSKEGKKYKVSFDVYNSKYHNGAVDIFDENGTWIGSEIIKKYSDISSLWDTGEQAFYLISNTIALIPGGKDSNFLTYEQESFSKHTHIEIEVPDGGCFTISNNFAESMGTFLYNACEILYEGVSTLIDLATADSIDVSTFSKLIANDIADDPISRKMFQEIFIKTVDNEIRSYSKNILSGNVSSAYAGISELLENILDSLNIEWKHLFKSVTGVGESIFSKLSGPAGLALKGCFAISKGTNKFSQAIDLAKSIDETYANVYSKINEGTINSHGVIINTNGNIDSEAVLQVFRISNSNIADTIINKDNSLEKYELYNICFVKNDTLVQPKGKVKVYIPIPDGMNSDTCNVYRQEDDDNWTVLDAHVEGNYLVFETDHFSFYAVIGDVAKAEIKTLPEKLDYYIGETLDSSGLTLIVNEETIDSGFICTPTVIFKEGEQMITVKYGSSTVTFNVNVSQKTDEYDNQVLIRTPSTASVDYGDSIILHLDIDRPLPDGAYIEWSESNGNFDMSVSTDGLTCKISPKSNGKTVFTATVYDKDGNVISSDTQEMTAKAGLWQKIVAFFKKIFGLTKTIPEAFKGIF